MTTAPPRELPGTVNARLRDAPRIAAWQWRGWAHGAVRGPWRGRAVSAVCLVAGTPLWPLLAALVAVQAALPGVRLYLDPERTAVLGIATTSTGWRLENHSTGRPGTGAGARLRALVIPELLNAADRHGVAVYLDASAPALARAYMRELPGLRDERPALLRGRRLSRPPPA